MFTGNYRAIIINFRFRGGRINCDSAPDDGYQTITQS